jgi:hypothetical protein
MDPEHWPEFRIRNHLTSSGTDLIRKFQIVTLTLEDEISFSASKAEGPDAYKLFLNKDPGRPKLWNRIWIPGGKKNSVINIKKGCNEIF